MLHYNFQYVTIPLQVIKKMIWIICNVIGDKMKRIMQKGIAAGALVTAAGILAIATGCIEQYRTIVVKTDVSPAMCQVETALEADLTAKQEAQEVVSVIQNMRTISLASYGELQNARTLYNSVSSKAQEYIDEAQLLEAEAVYAELEAEREVMLLQAEENGRLDEILEYAPCQIQTSGDETLDTLVQELIQNAVTEDMTRSEQLKACYTYMVEHYTYGFNYNYRQGNVKSIAWATVLLRDGYGACNNWSAAFMYVARALGYEADLYYGATAAAGGGTTEHYWPVIRIHGTEYVFDPQVEADMTRRSGIVAYKRYGIVDSGKYYYQKTVE